MFYWYEHTTFKMKIIYINNKNLHRACDDATKSRLAPSSSVPWPQPTSSGASKALPSLPNLVAPIRQEDSMLKLYKLREVHVSWHLDMPKYFILSIILITPFNHSTATKLTVAVRPPGSVIASNLLLVNHWMTAPYIISLLTFKVNSRIIFESEVKV